MIRQRMNRLMSKSHSTFGTDLIPKPSLSAENNYVASDENALLLQSCKPASKSY
ncbi:MAG: hypothetical protein WA734_20880 [Candidatus Acidiferrales bacterium]